VIRRAAPLLVLPFSSCLTMHTWDLPDEPRTTTLAIASCTARLGVAPDGEFVFVTLAIDGRGPYEIVMVPEWQRSTAVRDAMRDRPEVTLHLRHDTSPNWRCPEWSGQLDFAKADGRGDARTIPLRDVPPSHGEASGPTNPIAIARVSCDEYEVTHPIGVGGIAWRVAVTPFAVVADLVLAIPLGLIGGYFLLTDPAILTGG